MSQFPYMKNKLKHTHTQLKINTLLQCAALDSKLKVSEATLQFTQHWPEIVHSVKMMTNV